MSGLIDSTTGLAFGSSLQFQTPIGKGGLTIVVGPQIALAPRSVAQDAAAGTLVGLLSVLNGVGGTYAFTLTDTAGNKFAIDGVDDTRLEVGATALTLPSADIVVRANNGLGSIINQPFTITITPVEITAPSLTLDSGAASNPADLLAGDFDATVHEGDVVRLQYDDNPSFSSPTAVTHTLDAGDIVAGEYLFSGITLDPSTTYYFRARIERGGIVSDWSVTVTDTTADLDAPVLTLLSVSGANPPDFSIAFGNDVVVGDVVRLEWDTDPGFGSPDADSNTLDAAEILAGEIEMMTGQLAAGTWYFRARLERGAAVSGWSNTVTDTLTVAPVLSDATATETGQTTADLSVDTDQDNGTLYWVVTQSATPPSAAEVKAGEDDNGDPADDSGNQAVSGTGTQDANATGLTADTEYWAYFMHENTDTNKSAVAASASFTTEAAAGFTLVASTNTTGAANSPLTTGAIVTTDANLLVIAVGAFGNNGAITVSDSKSNTWTSLTTRLSPGGVGYSRLYYCVPTSVGSGHTFSATNGGGIFGELAVMAWSGAHASPFDAENGATTAGATSLQTGSVTPSQDNSLLIAACCPTDNTSNYSINSGFTESADVPFLTATNEGLLAAYLLQGAATAVNPTFSWTTSAEAAAAIAVFKPA